MSTSPGCMEEAFRSELLLFVVVVVNVSKDVMDGLVVRPLLSTLLNTSSTN